MATARLLDKDATAPGSNGIWGTADTSVYLAGVNTIPAPPVADGGETYSRQTFCADYSASDADFFLRIVFGGFCTAVR